MTSYQFVAGGATAGPAAARELEAAIARYVTVTVVGGATAARHTASRLEAEAARAAEWLTSVGLPLP